MPYDLAEFQRSYKPNNAETEIDISDGKVISPSANIQRQLSTVEDSNWLGGDKSRQDFAVLCALLSEGHSQGDALATFIASPRGEDVKKRKPDPADYFQRTIRKALAEGSADEGFSVEIIDEDSDWRKEFKSKNQLCRDAPRYIVQRLVPEKALTFITAPSFHGKSWLVLHLGAAMSVGRGLWRFQGPQRPVPFRYHVPEMDESRVRQRMEQLHIADSDMFLVRAMETGPVWRLDDELMMESARGAVVCLDTTGYFNEADDTANYQQAVRFGKLVFKLLTDGGALAVIGLYHPPKYSEKETHLSLENSVLGSAGYGGILRSCLAVRNLNPDPNDINLWLYVQGLKNPGLKPFQLKGIPLTTFARPSPYLSEVLKQRAGQNKTQSKRAQVLELLEKGKSVRSIAEELHISHNTVTKYRKESCEE